MTSFRFLHSSLAKQIFQFVNWKRSSGHTYKTEVWVLSDLDKFIFENYPNTETLTREIALRWSEKRSHENEANRKRRICVVRQFSKFLQENGCDAWVIPTRFIPHIKKYVPYIFSASELRAMIEYIDSMPLCSNFPIRNKIYPLFFRLLICCGMRLGEAINLKISDIDIKSNVIKIRHSKNGKRRLVPFNSYLAHHIEEYFNSCCLQRSAEDFLFSYSNGERSISVYPPHSIFQEALSYAHIKHQEPNHSPRIHDFRHTFVVIRLKLWIGKGVDLSSKLPFLWHYLGHKSFYEMSYYFHLVSEMWPGIINKAEERYPNLIPAIDFDLQESPEKEYYED